MESKKFKDTCTGEIVTQFNIMDISHMEEVVEDDNTMKKDTRERLEAIIREDSENMPYKYRDIRSMFIHGIIPYKEWSEAEINEHFTTMEYKVTEEDKEWATYDL